MILIIQLSDTIIFTLIVLMIIETLDQFILSSRENTHGECFGSYY